MVFVVEVKTGEAVATRGKAGDIDGDEAAGACGACTLSPPGLAHTCESAGVAVVAAAVDGTKGVRESSNRPVIDARRWSTDSQVVSSQSEQQIGNRIVIVGRLPAGETSLGRSARHGEVDADGGGMRGNCGRGDDDG